MSNTPRPSTAQIPPSEMKLPDDPKARQAAQRLYDVCVAHEDKVKKLNDERIQAFFDAFEAGVPINAIAGLSGKTRFGVYYILNNNGEDEGKGAAADKDAAPAT